MKNLFLTLTLVLFGLGVFAQQNVIKIGVGSAIRSDIYLKYERAFAEKHSFQIGILADTRENFNITKPIWFLGPDADPDYDMQVGGFAIVPEYRYYFSGAGAPRGFYAGAYARYRQRNVTFESDFNTNIDLVAKGNMWNVGAGIGIGAQFLIADKFAIDWYIGGIGYNRYFASASVEAVNEDDFDQLKLDLAEEVNKFEIPTDQVGGDFVSDADVERVRDLLLTAIDATQSRAFNSGTIPFGSIEVRAGLSIGYAF